MLNRKIYDKSSEWKKGPSINEWPSNDTTHVAFFDENGNSNMIDIINGKNNEENMDNYFSLTCILIDNDKLNAIKNNINILKEKYWANGIYTYISKDGCKINKKVCFHSREIRKKIGPFSVNEINYDSFMTDLTDFITSQEFIILHCFINKKELLKKYGGLVKDPYELAITFIFEVLLGKILKSHDKLECIFESRGKKEDKMLHNL